MEVVSSELRWKIPQPKNNIQLWKYIKVLTYYKEPLVKILDPNYCTNFLKIKDHVEEEEKEKRIKTIREAKLVVKLFLIALIIAPKWNNIKPSGFREAWWLSEMHQNLLDFGAF